MSSLSYVQSNRTIVLPVRNLRQREPTRNSTGASRRENAGRFGENNKSASHFNAAPPLPIRPVPCGSSLFRAHAAGICTGTLSRHEPTSPAVRLAGRPKIKRLCCLLVVRTAGLEPARGRPQRILSPLRLPVPPRPRRIVLASPKYHPNPDCRPRRRQSVRQSHSASGSSAISSLIFFTCAIYSSAPFFASRT